MFNELATLERAGMPIAKSIATVASTMPVPLAESLERMGLGITNGDSLTKAGRSSGLWRGVEPKIVELAENAGQLESAFDHLGGGYERQAARLKRALARSLYPLAIVILLVVLVPLPALFAAELSPGGYLVRVLAMLLAVGVLLRGIWRSMDSPRAGSGLTSLLLAPLTGAVPGLRRLRTLLGETYLFRHTAWLLGAGLAPADSMQLLGRHAANASYRDALRVCALALGRGRSFADCVQAELVSRGYCDQDTCAMIDVGEAAGRLPATLAHVAEMNDRRLDELLDTAMEWLPRVLYAIVVGFVVAGFF
jgi:type II secretory pathway component PulF